MNFFIIITISTFSVCDVFLGISPSHHEKSFPCSIFLKKLVECDEAFLISTRILKNIFLLFNRMIINRWHRDTYFQQKAIKLTIQKM